MIKIIFFLISILFFESAAFSIQSNAAKPAPFQVIVTFSNKNDFKSFAQDKEILKIENIFKDKEKGLLSRYKMDALLNSKILTLKDELSYQKLKNKIENSNIKISMSPRVIEANLSSLDLRALQWGMQNNGEPQGIDIDPLTFFKVQARKGEDININSVKSFSGNKIIVAVLDTGVQVDHPSLKNIIKTNPTECVALEKYQSCLIKNKKIKCDDQNNKNQECDKENSKKENCDKTWLDLNNPEVDQDHNGYPLDCRGWSLLSGLNVAGITGAPVFEDKHGHGTHVSGIIGAQFANENAGVKGVSSNVQILPVQVIGGGPSEPIKPLSVELDENLNPKEEKLPRPQRKSFLADMVARGVIYAVNSGAKVINFSMGWPQSQDSDFLRKTILEAQKRGIVIVAAAGNDSTRAILRPCAYPGVICVGASGPDGAIAHYSNYGSGVDILAPGTNILSTYPESLRPIHMRQINGFEYLTGTSQATPFISGLIADMLSRGYSVDEARARLLASARPTQKPLNLIYGPPHDLSGVDHSFLDSHLDQSKYILTGNVDYKKAITMQPVPFIVPVEKDKIEIKWDGQSSQIPFQFKVKNIWQKTKSSDVRVSVQMKKESTQLIRPSISDVKLLNGSDIWNTNEERTVQLNLNIVDDLPENSRIPSELEFVVTVDVGHSKRSFVVEAEIIKMLNLDKAYKNMTVIPIEGTPQERVEYLPCKASLDGTFTQDYWLVSYNQTNWQFWLMKMDASGKYIVSQALSIPAPTKNADAARISIHRVSTKNNISEYLISVYEDKSNEQPPMPSPNYFYVVNSNMQMIENFKYDSVKSQIPFDDGLKWIQINGKVRPLWVGPGYDPDFIQDLWDVWQDPENKNERMAIRLYYLNEKAEIKAIQKYKGFEIVDLLEPTTQQKKSGIVPVLLAKNQGTELIPSYVYDFATAYFISEEITGFSRIEQIGGDQKYRNLLDTRVGQVYSLDYENELNKGTFWFSEGRIKEQRLSYILNNNSEVFNYSLKALRGVVDSVLWVRSVFIGKKVAGAFALTNSEIQFHDLLKGRIVQKSMDRYSFFTNSTMVNLQFPIMVNDTKVKTKLPAIYTTEGSGLSRGVKITLPYYDPQGNLQELIAPANLRLRIESGCKPMDDPVWGGVNSASYLDYFCSSKEGQKMLRVEMNY